MGTLHLTVNVHFSHLEATPGDWLPARLVFYFLTLAPRDYVTYCQARGLSEHTSPCGECALFSSRGYARGLAACSVGLLLSDPGTT